MAGYPRKIRNPANMDRILCEATADGVRRLTDLFGVAVPTAERYAFNGVESTEDTQPTLGSWTDVIRQLHGSTALSCRLP